MSEKCTKSEDCPRKTAVGHFKECPRKLAGTRATLADTGEKVEMRQTVKETLKDNGNRALRLEPVVLADGYEYESKWDELDELAPACCARDSEPTVARRPWWKRVLRRG